MNTFYEFIPKDDITIEEIVVLLKLTFAANNQSNISGIRVGGTSDEKFKAFVGTSIRHFQRNDEVV